jgi:REP element-mobilizing transposase RayT
LRFSENPVVIAHHLIWTVYGYWLPNDPRGSHSRVIRNDVIAELGELPYGRKRVQPAGRVVQRFREQAADVLKHPLLTFDEAAREEIAIAFAQVVTVQHYTCYACAIMPDHVHILIRKHKHQAEEMMQHLKDASRNRLIATGHRAADHPVWTSGTGWKVFLETPDDIHRTVRYIERNPSPLGLPVQRWKFVAEYDNWLLHKRAKRIR